MEGLIHVTEMSWSKKNVKAADIVKPGEMVEVVVLGVNPADKQNRARTRSRRWAIPGKTR